MQIRNKLTLLFVLVVALILFFSSLSIYFFSADYRSDDFYTRLLNKANNTAKLLIEVEEVDANLLKRIEKDNPVSLPKEKIIIYSFQNELIFSTDENNDLVVTQEILDKARLEGEFRYKQGDYEVVCFLFADKYDRFVVIAGAVDIYGLKKLRNLQIILIIVFGISIVFVFLLGWIYSGKALQPILKIIDQVNAISITSMNLRVDEGNGKDEIARLANTFNSMLERLEKAFEMQKNFITNASHELRTPLTAITGQLEVALLKERTIVEYQDTLISALEDMKSLNSLSNKLLLLAQASSYTVAFDFKPLRIDDIIWQARTDLLTQNKQYSVNVSLDDGIIDDKQLTIMGNEQLLKTAIGNLIENGCKYTANHQLILKINTIANGIVLQFTDQGIGIEKEDLAHVFEPLYRGKNALAIHGHGIGLSLVEYIIKLHKGSIKVESELNQGTTFTLVFPFINS